MTATTCVSKKNSINMENELAEHCRTRILQIAEEALQRAEGLKQPKERPAPEYSEGIGGDILSFLHRLSKFESEISSVETLLYQFDEVMTARPSLYVERHISERLEKYGANRKLWSSSNDGSKFDNFYSPDNEKFYAQSPYHCLDPDMGEIRLLEVVVGQSHDGLEFHLVDNIPLDEVEANYWAISYNAGDPTDTEKIKVDGLEFNIFATAFAALQQVHKSLRRATTEGQNVGGYMVWVDQVCIDQSDHKERSHQVAMMRQIYENANEVLVWLGPDPTEGVAFNWLHRQAMLIGDYVRGECGDADDTVTASMATDYMVRASKNSLESLARPELMALVKGLADFMSRPWWTRCWVAQELVVARKARLLLGNRMLEWFTFTIAIRALRPIFGWLVDSGPNIETYNDNEIDIVRTLFKAFDAMSVFGFFEEIRDLIQQSPSAINLKTLLEHSRSCQASDPRDRIYAFLSLAGPSYGVEIDYTARNTREALLIHTATRIILTEQRLDILSHLEFDNRPVPGVLPSWVPTWTPLPDEKKTLLYIDTKFGDFPYFKPAEFDASNGHKTLARFRLERQDGCSRPFNVLSVRGLVIDVLASTSTFGAPETFDTWFSKKLENWKRMAMNHRTQDFAIDGSLEEALLDVVGLGVGIEAATRESESSLRSIVQSLNNWMDGWHFFISPKGYLGIANPRAQPTDFICILLGARVPYILRKAGSYYTVVGEAYVQGLMHGKAISLVGQGLEDEVLDIV